MRNWDLGDKITIEAKIRDINSGTSNTEKTCASHK